MFRRPLTIALQLLLPFFLIAQSSGSEDNTADGKDLPDIIQQVVGKKNKSADTVSRYQHIRIGVLPAVGYTLQTGFATVVSANMVVYKRRKKDSLLPSTVIASLSYTQKNQVIFPFQTVIYLSHNKAVLISDWRFLKYPSFTYGLGMHSSPSDQNLLDFQYFKFHESVLFQLAPQIYAGGGYAFDYFWKVKEVHPHPNPVTDFEKYGYRDHTISSGLMFHLLRDTRDNPINAYSGTFANILVSPRSKFLGSDASWTTMHMEWRGYFRFPANSNNILALWSYNWFTLGGRAPYLMLPSTAWDKSYNTGRGYIQGRFRSNNMLDAETEYRIRLTKNGLLGMVLFGNLESFSEIGTFRFGSVAPAGGLGLRVKLNKYSRTNISIDYGLGRQGSRGFFVNLGEIF
ncbi:MAG: BamA/TamA family outer membrane protein [Bacteroidota bacterium]|nr:BamA/TamA family outer membrane protein [Bacteroidota bacterium]